MALVVFRGAIQGLPADEVTTRAIIAMLVFYGVGWVAGWIIDYLIRDAVEQMFRKRVEWYRKGLIEAGYLDDSAN
jgi:hypothetical protein